MQVDPVILTVIMFGLMCLGMLIGMPLTFVLGVTSVITVMLMWGTEGGISMLYFSFLSITYSFSLSAVPLFIFLGIVLEKSGIGNDFFDMIYKWLGGISGGLTIGTLGVCAIVAAMVGQTGPATIMMGLIALPEMLKHGYDKRMCSGAIQAGGALGILIPPSVPMIVYGFLAQQSVGRLFAAGIMPGILLMVIFIIYVYVRCKINPKMGPPLPKEERATWGEKFISLKGIILPLFLIFSVLGLIVFGVTSATESAGIGAAGALLCAALRRNLNIKVLKESVYSTAKIMGTVMWIIIPAVAFSKIYQGLGAQQLIENVIGYFDLGRYGVLALMMVTYYILGCFLETGAIIFLTMPLYVPIIIKLGFDPIWFGILYIMNIESAYLTPPYGFNLFYMKAIAPKEITLVDIYMSVIPFVGLQVVGLISVIVFPDIVLWLPNLLFNK